MKVSKLVLLMVSLSTPALAQVNMDQPLNAGQSDMVFRSSVDPKVAYSFPIGLSRIGAPIAIRSPKDRLIVQLNIGVSAEDFKVVRAQLDKNGFQDIQIRYLKPIQFSISDSTSIDPKFDPRVIPLGDMNLAGPMPIALSLKQLWSLFGQSKTSKMLEDLLNGPRQAAHIGNLYYEYDAIVAGKPYLGKTAVGIFIGSSFAQKSGASLSAYSESIRSIDQQSSEDTLLMDSQSHCWDNVKPGTFCLREKQ